MGKHIAQARSSTPFLLIAALAVGIGTVGCGAKTGLDVPDGGPEPDAGLPEADAAVPCVEVPLDGGTIELPLEIETELRRADVLFLIDVTASMQDEIDRIRASLRDRLSPAIEAEIPDSQLAVATFADFPIDPHGDPDDDPFTLMLPMTDDISRVQAAVNAIELGNGRDEPESQVEALYQVATGEGLSPFVSPSFGCPMGGFGYPCFRTDALPIVLLFTDAPFHNGPGGRNPYMGISPTPHNYGDALTALNSAGVRVIGFDSGDGDAERDLRQVAGDTDALNASGDPLVFEIGRGGERLDTSVVDAMKTFAEAVEFDVDAVAGDPTPGDGLDVTDFVESIAPLRAEPMDGIGSIDEEAGVFRAVQSGTTVVFEVRIRNDAVVPGPEPQRFLLEVLFRGDGRTNLGRRLVEIVIPGADGEGCIDNEGSGGT